MDKSPIDTVDAGWSSLYKIGGAAALILVLIIPAQIVVFSVAPPPKTVLEWFALFQNNKLLGLLSFELLFIVYGAVSIPMSLALYVALRRADQSLTALYLGLSLVGVVGLFVARPAFEMLYLSDQYAAAATDAQRSTLLAAGQAMLALFYGTAFQVSYVLGSVTGLIISVVMLKSSIFSRPTAYLRIAASVLDFGIYVPVIGLFISVFSVLLLMIWNLLVARRLFQLGQGKAALLPGQP